MSKFSFHSPAPFPIRGSIRDSVFFAFSQGFQERLTVGESFGRTHPTSLMWNEAYDHGRTVAEKVQQSRPAKALHDTAKKYLATTS